MYLRPHVAFFCIIFHVSALDDSYKRRSSYREHILSIIFIDNNPNLLFVVLDKAWADTRHEKLEDICIKYR